MNELMEFQSILKDYVKEGKTEEEKRIGSEIVMLLDLFIAFKTEEYVVYSYGDQDAEAEAEA